MASKIRQKLEEQLDEYILDTLKYTETVKKFCDQIPDWTRDRKSEVDKMTNIKIQCETLGAAIWSRLKSDYSIPELTEVLKNISEGLEKLCHFLDAVEKLAVTSLFAFINNLMPKEKRSSPVCFVILVARIASPYLIHFKRDIRAFFKPSLYNVEVLIFQLNNYIIKTNEISEVMEKGLKCMSDVGGVYKWRNEKRSPKFNLSRSEEKLRDHLVQLIKIRKDKSFRLNFIFGVKAQDFIKVFSEHRSMIFQYTSDLEGVAFQLENMKMGSNISSVAGSSVSIAGGILSILGLALIPFTAGGSLGLTIAGTGFAVTSGVNSIVTEITEVAVNSHQEEKAKKTFMSLMENVQKISDCIEDVTSKEVLEERAKTFWKDLIWWIEFSVKQVVHDVGVGYKAYKIYQATAAVKALRSKEVIAKAISMGLHEASAGRSIPKLAADLPDIGQLAKGTPLALSKLARAGSISLNALFIGLDVFYIYRVSDALSKGSKSEKAQNIRSKTALWRSELEAWETIHNHLLEGISGFSKNYEILNEPFYI